MKKQFFKYALVLSLLVVGFKVFFPRTYSVETRKNSVHTEYWQLPTGSHIGYTLVHAIGHEKNYFVLLF